MKMKIILELLWLLFVVLVKSFVSHLLFCITKLFMNFYSIKKKNLFSSPILNWSPKLVFKIFLHLYLKLRWNNGLELFEVNNGKASVDTFRVDISV